MASALCVIASAQAAGPLDLPRIAGWWCDDPRFAQESSRVCLHFLEDKGQPAARLSLFGIRGYDAPLGTVTFSGQTLDMQPYPFALTYDPAKDTLSGVLPEAAVPLYKIPVEFRRSAPIPKPAPPTWDHAQPKVAWTFDAGAAVWAGLERDGATGYTFVGTDSGRLYALDASGSQRWIFDTGGAIKARPSVIGDSVYVASDAGNLYRLTAREGREVWRARIDTGSPARIPASEEKSRWDRYGSSAIADGNSVYVASRDKNLYALDIATGRERWRVAAGDMMTATPVLYEDLVLFAAFDGKVQAVRASDGLPRWSYDARLAVPGDLTIADKRVFVGSRTYDLIALDASTGRELWKHYYWFSWIESPPVPFDGVVYTGSSDGVGVYAIDAANGSLRWKADVPGWAWARPAVTRELIVAGTVGKGAFPGARSGALVAVDRRSGALRWIHVPQPSQDVVEKRADWGFAASPVVANDVVYAADLAGRVYAMELGSPGR